MRKQQRRRSLQMAVLDTTALWRSGRRKKKPKIQKPNMKAEIALPTAKAGSLTRLPAASNWRNGPATPLVQRQICGWPVWLKLEKENPAGSHKDRPTLLFVAFLLLHGWIGRKPMVLIISSSGNCARALAFYTTGLGVKLIVVTDALSPVEQIESLRAFPHVEVVVINDPDATGSHAIARKKFVEGFLKKHPNAVCVDQYSSSFFPRGYDSLVEEIEAQTPGTVSAIFMSAGTGATGLCLANFKIKKRRRWKLFLVDATSSALFGKPMGKRLNSGYGNGKPTSWTMLATPSIDAVIRVPDAAAIQTCRRLSQNDGLHLGASSGATVAAFEWLATNQPFEIPNFGFPVLICPDGGHLYSSTVYNDQFLRDHGLNQLTNGKILTNSN